jgi:hypothetical protein
MSSTIEIPACIVLLSKLKKRIPATANSRYPPAGKPGRLPNLLKTCVKRTRKIMG